MDSKNSDLGGKPAAMGVLSERVLLAQGIMA